MHRSGYVVRVSTVLVTLTDAEGCLVATVSGEVDVATVDELTAPLLAALTARPVGLVLDTTDVAFFGAAGMNSLDAITQQAKDHDVEIAAAGMSKVGGLVLGEDRAPARRSPRAWPAEGPPTDGRAAASRSRATRSAPAR